MLTRTRTNPSAGEMAANGCRMKNAFCDERKRQPKIKKQAVYGPAQDLYPGDNRPFSNKQMSEVVSARKENHAAEGDDAWCVLLVRWAHFSKVTRKAVSEQVTSEPTGN